VALVVAMSGILFASAPDTRDGRNTLNGEIRHQLVMLPYYNVFDWLEANVSPNGTVTLMGAVTRPTTKDDAVSRIKHLEGVTQVVDNIKVLPLSTMDDQLRVALYRSIFNYNSPLFRYATQSVPPIHIIVENGHATLKGVVANATDKQMAYIKASGVSGVFDVRNELKVE